MSTENLYEYIKGEFKAINRVKQQPVADDADTWFRDENQVKLAGYNIEIWDSATAGTQLTLGTDYVLALRDEAISGNEGFDVYAGYSIINAIYQGVDLYLTANIVGGYTSRPYRPTFTTVTANTTLNPSSMDDSIIADSTAGGFTITLGTPEYDNQRVAVICSGDNLVEISGPGLDDESYSNLALQYVGIGGIWLQLGGAGGGGGGNLSVGNFVWDPSTGAVPSDKLVADGSIYDIANYPALFARYGTLYGGDGITTFGVPDMQGITPGAFGTQDVNGRTKGDATAIGGVREDTIQNHNHASANNPTYGLTTQNVGVQTGIGAAAAQDLPTFAGLGEAIISKANEAIEDPRVGEYTRATELVGRWLIQAFDTVQEVPGDPSIIRDYVLVWPLAGELPAVSIQNIWGDGLFYAGIEYDYGGETHRSNGSLAVIGDDLPREVIFTADLTSTDSIAKFLCDETGLFTTNVTGAGDFTNLKIVGLYKWGYLASGELDPPVDGWETVFDDPANVGDVVNAWGVGEYSVYISDILAGVDASFKLQVTDLADDTRSASMSLGNITDAYMYAVHSSGSFSAIGAGNYAGGNITQIKKFNGLLNVIHTDANGIIQDEDVGGQWVTRWGTGKMEISGVSNITANTVFAVGPILVDNVAHNIPFSVPFVVTPVSNVSNFPVGNLTRFYVSLAGVSTTVLQVFCYNLINESGASYTVHWTATGRWK